MRNKDLHVASQSTDRIILGKENMSEIMDMKQEIDRLKEKISELQLLDEMKWSDSAIQIIFRSEHFARKYKTRIENFLADLFDRAGEPFNVDYKISQIHEPQYVVGPNDSFCIDRDQGDSPKNGPVHVVPNYVTSFDEVLHCDEPKEDSEEKEEPDEKCQVVTCFNCLGNHHMKSCPEGLDRLRIAANRKDYQTNSSRYHEEEQLNSTMRPGSISDALREALGLESYHIPLHVYHMRILGYPPGWMNEALLETSGLSLYDSEGKAVADESAVLSREPKYDGKKFVNYPGFNTPVPNGFNDDWKELKMPPIQAHQQLSKALKSPSTVNAVNLYKRKSSSHFSDEIKKAKDTPKGLNNSHSSWKPQLESTPKCNSPNYRTPTRNGNKNYTDRRNTSLAVSPGTPIMEQGNAYRRLPDSDKFAEGITEHMPFENLPDAVGTFEKMRGVLSSLHQKQNLLMRDVS